MSVHEHFDLRGLKAGKTAHTRLPLPPSFYSIAFGLVGLARVWRLAGSLYGLSAAIGNALFLVAALVYLLFFMEKKSIRLYAVDMKENNTEQRNASLVFCPNGDCRARGKMGEGNIVSHGKARQRYRCKICQKTFSAKAGTMFEGLRKPPSLIVIVVTLVAYGCPTQAIVQAFGLDERTVASWQQRAGKHCQQVQEAVVQQGQLALVHVQADEIRVKGCKMIAWMGLAMMVSTRLWLGGVVQVTRDRKLSDRLFSQVRACCQPLRALLVCTDGWSAYPGSIRRAFRKISQNDCWARTGVIAGMAQCFYCDSHQAHGKKTRGRSRAANDSGDAGASPEALTPVSGVLPEIVPAGRILSPFSQRMTGPDHRAPLFSCALLATGKECSWWWHGYDCS